MSTLAELYALVRQQTQTTEEELPDSWINPWLQQAFNRTVGAYAEWPLYEHLWYLTLTSGEYTIDLPSDVNDVAISSLLDDRGERLYQTSHNNAEKDFQHSFGSWKPFEFSVWGRVITLWPNITFDEDKSYTLRGFRLPMEWPTTSNSVPDCDDRLHPALANYATALAYAQQEDEVLEDKYMQRWQRDVETIVPEIVRPRIGTPMMAGPRHRLGVRSF
jgi:hypothetical protein